MLTPPPSPWNARLAGTQEYQPGSRASGAVRGCAGLKAQAGSPVTVGPGTPVLVKGRARCAWLRVCTCLLQTREGPTENQAQWMKVGLRAAAPAAASRHRPVGMQRPPALVRGPPPASCPVLLTQTCGAARSPYKSTPCTPAIHTHSHSPALTLTLTSPRSPTRSLSPSDALARACPRLPPLPVLRAGSPPRPRSRAAGTGGAKLLTQQMPRVLRACTHDLFHPGTETKKNIGANLALLFMICIRQNVILLFQYSLKYFPILLQLKSKIG